MCPHGASTASRRLTKHTAQSVVVNPPFQYLAART